MQKELWFNKYHIIKHIGRGGTADVYLATHSKLGSLRAIKRISKKNPLYFTALKEAHVLKSLNHPSIPIIYDVEEDENYSYIIEEFIDGQTLCDYRNELNEISQNQIINLAYQICELINYLHSLENPILYLDLKPNNIIIKDNNIKLIDFGSVISLTADETIESYQGTKGYAGPELYKKDKVDKKSDIYGIGMIIYYLSTGKQIALNEMKIENVDYEQNVSLELKNIINKCINHNPSLRYSSVNQLKQKLLSLKNNLVISKCHNKTISIAGAQRRVGVTHLCLQIARFFKNSNLNCLYQENNFSNDALKICERHDFITEKDGVFNVKGIKIRRYSEVAYENWNDYHVIIKDYGCLDNDNLNKFMEADIKILIMGSKEWEISKSENVLMLLKDFEKVKFVFNYIDGHMFKHVCKNMMGYDCYRMPYEPNVFSLSRNNNQLEFISELTGMYINKGSFYESKKNIIKKMFNAKEKD